MHKGRKVPGCECTPSYTCGACLDDCADRNLADKRQYFSADGCGVRKLGLTLKEWRSLGGCGLSHSAEWQLRDRLGQAVKQFELRDLGFLFHHCPQAERELRRFAREQPEQLRGKAKELNDA